jgi:hypothetical protein
LYELGGSAVPGRKLERVRSSKTVGSVAEAENVELMKSGEENGWFYGVKVRRSILSAPVFMQLDREAILNHSP